MKNQWIILLSIISLTIFTLPLASAQYKPDDTFTELKPLVLLDFDNKKVPMNSVGGAWGTFDANPNDKEAFIRWKYLKDTDLHKAGYVLKVSYDVESSQPAFNGIWTKLNGLSLKDFQALSITIKGDKEKGFSDFFKVEIKDKSTKIESTVEDISTDWKKIVLPFDQFEGDTDEIDMANLAEFTIVFEDWKFKQKTGTYYIDDISFLTKKGSTVKYSDIAGATKKGIEKKDEKDKNKKGKEVKEEKEE